MKIIALGHRKRVGKNTLAGGIASYLRFRVPALRVQVAGFADELKVQTHRLYAWAGLQDAAFYERHPDFREIELPDIGKTPRQIWIEYGNKVREVYPETWVDFLLKRASADVLIITDLRYPNEFEKVRIAGGKCIKVERFAVPPSWDKADVALAHVPDQVWDAIVLNDGDVHKLDGEAVTLVEQFVL